MSKKSKNRKNQVLTRDMHLRRVPTKTVVLHESYSRPLINSLANSVYASDVRKVVRKPIEAPASSNPIDIGRKVSYGSFHRSMDINQRRLSVCAKRQIRTEVLHAKGAAGKRVRPPKYTLQSKIKCKG